MGVIFKKSDLEVAILVRVKISPKHLAKLAIARARGGKAEVSVYDEVENKVLEALQHDMLIAERETIRLSPKVGEVALMLARNGV